MTSWPTDRLSCLLHEISKSQTTMDLYFPNKDMGAPASRWASDQDLSFSFYIAFERMMSGSAWLDSMASRGLLTVYASDMGLAVLPGPVWPSDEPDPISHQVEL